MGYPYMQKFSEDFDFVNGIQNDQIQIIGNFENFKNQILTNFLYFSGEKDERKAQLDLRLIPFFKMTDKDYAPLSAHCVRALCDKMYDKRKAAALEIEKLTKDCIQINNQTQVQKLLRVLGTEFASSQNPNMRKGGLIGLAAMAIGMGKDSHNYVNELVKPVLNCMDDTDCRVRFYACESLYNVTKVTRDEVLPLFNDLFIGKKIL